MTNEATSASARGGATLSRAEPAEQYKVRRAAKRLLTLSEYLDTGGGGAPINSPQICQVMEVAVGGKGAEDPGWRNFPWLTLLLGSGCLELPYAVDRRAVNIRNTVGAEVPGLLAQVGDRTLAASVVDGVKSFVEALVVDRSHPVAQGEDHGDGFPELVLHPAATRLAIAAQTLTHVFFLANVDGEQPLSHWDDDVVEVDVRSDDELDALVALAVEQLEAVRPLLDVPGQYWDINDVLSSIIERVLDRLGLRMPRLHLVHLRLLTDLTWYLLNLGTNAYPGWADLLLGLMLREAGDQAEMARGRPRLTTQRRIPGLVERLFAPPTVESWKTIGLLADEEPDAPVAGPVLRRNEFYAEAARTLWAQDALVRPGSEPTDLEVDWSEKQFPAVSAFIGSFDIELEMALWATAPVGEDGNRRPFFIVMPVHVVYSSGDTDEQATASLCWLRAEVRPDHSPSTDLNQRLGQIRGPGRWQVVGWSKEGEALSQGVVYDAQSFQAGPHVVHLSGCPLVRLPGRPSDGSDGSVPLPPDLVTGLEELGISVPVSDRVSPIEHAVIVDEYLAFTQSESELRRSMSARRVPRLHPFLLNSAMSPDRPGRNPRYWLAMGVPVTDSAIRQRILSQLVSSEGQLVHPQSRPARSPLATDEHLTPPQPERSATQLAWATGAEPVIEDSLGSVSSDSGPPGDVADGSRSDRRIPGAVVNRRITEDEAGIFYWLGLDVVVADSLRHTDHLRHYRTHLEAHEPPTASERAEWARPTAFGDDPARPRAAARRPSMAETCALFIEGLPS